MTSRTDTPPITNDDPSAPVHFENLLLNVDAYSEYDCPLNLSSTTYLSLDELHSFVAKRNVDKEYQTSHLLHINCRSLPHNFDSIRSFISSLGISLTAIATTETWLKPHNSSFFNIPGYEYISCSRVDKIGGGVGLYISENENWTLLSNISFVTEIIECIFVEIITDVKPNTVIGCIYKPPQSNINEFNNQIFDILQIINGSNKQVFILGDFNLNLLNHESHLPTSNFLNIMLSNGLKPTVTRPTRIFQDTSTLIDNIFSNISAKDCEVALIYSDISDHLPILLQYFSTKMKPAKSPTGSLVNKRNFSDGKIESFKTYLCQVKWNEQLENISDPDVMYLKFMDKFNEGFYQFFPKQAYTHNKNKPRKEWITSALVKSCKTKSKLYKQYLQHPSENSKTAFVTYRNKLNTLLTKAKNQFYINKVNSFGTDSRKVWRFVNNMQNNADKKHPNPVSILQIGNKQISNPTEIAECFNNYFTNVGQNLASHIPPSDFSFTHYLTKDRRVPNSCVFLPTCPQEIISIVSHMSGSDSSSFDEISTNFVKQIIIQIAHPLSELANSCFCTGKFPQNMKIAKVCPIYKSGSKNEMANYRPISILPTFSKILEKAIATRLTSFIEKEKILSESQYGFRKNHSTFMPIMKLHEKITQAIDNQEYCIGIFIDLSKAFDTINHDILIEKLNHYGIRGTPLRLLSNYLTDRTQFCSINNTVSSTSPITCGVPQGSVLGPLLFILYINDIIQSSHLLNFLLFADDTNILYSNKDINALYEIINHELKNLHDWFKANKLSLNVKKTNYISFGSKQYPPHHNILIDGKPITKTDYTKFLGVTIDNKINWQKHTKHICSKLSSALYLISRVKFYLPQQALRSIYYALIYPYLTYANTVWGNAANYLVNQIFVLQKRAIRLITHSHYLAHTTLLFKKLRILKLSDIILFQTAMFMYQSKNNLLPDSCRNLVNKNLDTSNRLRQTYDFLIPKYRTTLRSKCMTVFGPKCWINIPAAIKLSPSLAIFKKAYKNFILDTY